MADLSDHSFAHGRVKTFQPRDLWELLLQLAVILFLLDVAVRRIQLDRDEWLKATENLRRWIFFWQPRSKPVESDPGLASLLNRRSQVREKTIGEPRSDLFEPEKRYEVKKGEDAGTGAPKTASTPAEKASGDDSGAKDGEVEPESVTDRLLAAKRRARKKKL